GTLAAVVFAFWKDWLRLFSSAWRGALHGNPFAEPDGRLLGLVAVASVPGAVAGLVLEKWADSVLRSPALIAGTMAVMGAILFAADRVGGRKGTLESVTLRDALLIGISQAAAIVPGVSRSGATISMARLLGYRREESARFSFLLATPITFGAALVKVPRLLHTGGEMRPLLVGIGAAAVVGLLSIRGLLTYVRTKDYTPFVYYRLAFAIVVGIVFSLRS
ncbi:MAG: undecaprenyl-diphosphate phosphatase, partial [Thermoplasmata archaeon]|nr:undecaprenyl-diphosphate phosphatase [Thermoplasmata archaeon]